MDFTTCEPVPQNPGFSYFLRPSQRHRLSHSSLWSPKNGQQTRLQNFLWNTVPHSERNHGKLEAGQVQISHKHRRQLQTLLCEDCQARSSFTKKLNPSVSIKNRKSAKETSLKRARRQLFKNRRPGYDSQESFFDGGEKPTTVTGVIIWGPTEDDYVESSTPRDNIFTTTRIPFFPATTTRVARTSTHPETTTTSTTMQSRVVNPKGSTSAQTPEVVMPYPSRDSTTEPYAEPENADAAKPPRIFGDTAGLAVHQIITITVSLIMVIAALITTLVLKNCCAQSGNRRRNSHQRKINQQEESCQNLTDFTPARVPSNMDIFTAYNESLQCSHECVRAPVPVYTDETLHQTGVYKTTFNGNRPSSERQLIPVAFVSEKWFEISC
ncbi:adherens junction-associated protein 1 [Latimeria chalumnae]|uniref:adherens junction-associated protein 1 n=1 Tax=Latimeria chalumnae TaxID=7897 RepID=UPI0003C18EB3|nr:PREDICTED: adherens junction-associated protein 1 [Latimeria chalumnae]|eukprot:XP_005986158.1 PREDICTED: adherens junction-associated protein 1 [Latimeria chalumnae]